MPGKLTTHILDTAHGCPASQVKIDLYRLGDVTNPNDRTEDRTFLKSILTNSDGRANEPLLEGDAFQAGGYELIFHIGEYFQNKNNDRESIPFLNRIPIRFNVLDGNAHYHIPLLASPWSYSTYRGS